MKVAVIHNKERSGVINVFGLQARERYNPKTVERVAAALEKGGHNVRIIDGNINVIDQLLDFMPRVVQGEQPGMVFNMAYGIQGVSRYTHIPALLEMLGIPYVGSSPSGHAISLDKVTSKVLFQAHDLPTPRYWVFGSTAQIPDELPFPLIVKPKMEAVSLGVQVVHDLATLKTAVGSLQEEFRQQILVEEFIPGREFAVGLLGNMDPEVLPIVEFDFQGDDFGIQTWEEKMSRPKEKVCPARIDEKLAEEFRETTKGAFRALGIYDFARVDFRMDKNGKIYILEVNSMASLGQTGSYVMAAKKAGYTYESLINRMLDVAVERYFGKQQMNQVAAPEPLFKSLIKSTTTPLYIRLRSYLRGNLITMEELLSKMVDINSYVHNIEGVNSFGRWISNQLAPLGFQRQVFPRAEFGNMLYFTNHSEETNHILILGNLDNPVHYQDYVSFHEERGRLYGSGVSRGKGGLALMLGALQALRYTRFLKKVRIGILLVTDESLGGRSSKPLILEIAPKSHYVLGLHGAGLSGELVISGSGTLNYKIEITRVSTKSPPKETTERNDPVLYVTQKIAALKKLRSKEAGVEVILTSLQTRGAEDQAPDHAGLSFQIRYHSPDQREDLNRQVQRIFEVPGQSPLKVHIGKGPQRLPFIQSEASEKLFEHVERIAQTVEVRVQKTHSEISSLLCYVPSEIPALDGLGPVTGGTGTRGEHVVRDSLIDRAVLLANVIYNASRDFQS